MLHCTKEIPPINTQSKEKPLHDMAGKKILYKRWSSTQRLNIYDKIIVLGNYGNGASSLLLTVHPANGDNIFK